MALNKQAKILTIKQQELTLGYLERTRYPLRNKIIFMLSYKAGLRAKEIANLTWLMVCDSEGQLSHEINLINKASKGKQSGRTIPMHKDLAILLTELLTEQKKNEHFALTNRIITTERDNKTNPQVIVNFFYNLYKEIGFEGCSSHSGRRTFITTAAKNISLAGGTLNDICMLAGHSTLAPTNAILNTTPTLKRKLSRWLEFLALALDKALYRFLHKIWVK